MAATPRPTLIPLPDELRSPRLVVRPYRHDDAEGVYEAIAESREHLRPWMPWVDNHHTIDDARDYCARSAANWLLRADLSVGIFDTVDGRYLGGSGMHRVDWEARTFEIGYWIRATAEGRGYVRETVQLLARLAFDQLRANRVEIRCDAENGRSARVAERLGFVPEGRLRNDSLDTSGNIRDTLVFALIPADYARAQSGW